MVCYNRKPCLRLAFLFRFSSASNATSSEVLDEGVGMNNPNPEECDSSKSDARSCGEGGSMALSLTVSRYEQDGVSAFLSSWRSMAR